MTNTPVKNRESSPITHVVNKQSSSTHLIKGALAEGIAKDYLLKKGLKILHERFRTNIGEIDLIVRDKSCLVFVEVRSRGNNPMVDPLETVTHHKQRRIILTAQCYIQSRPWLANLECRFDVIGVLGDLLNPEITWIPDAFQLK